MEGPLGDKVLLLLKCIYGLKQASRLWNIHIDAVLGKINFMRLTADFDVYMMGEGEKRIILCLYVDDLGMLSKFLATLLPVKALLMQNFKMKDLGELKYMLGFEVRRQPNGDILVCQENYGGDVLKRFRMEDCRPASTPLDPGVWRIRLKKASCQVRTAPLCGKGDRMLVTAPLQ